MRARFGQGFEVCCNALCLCLEHSVEPQRQARAGILSRPITLDGGQQLGVHVVPSGFTCIEEHHDSSKVASQIGKLPGTV